MRLLLDDAQLDRSLQIYLVSASQPCRASAQKLNAHSLSRAGGKGRRSKIYEEYCHLNGGWGPVSLFARTRSLMFFTTSRCAMCMRPAPCRWLIRAPFDV